jgi:hypothetical protein
MSSHSPTLRFATCSSVCTLTLTHPRIVQAGNLPEQMKSMAAELEMARAAAGEALAGEAPDVELLRAEYEAALSSLRTQLIHAEVRLR